MSFGKKWGKKKKFFSLFFPLCLTVNIRVPSGKKWGKRKNIFHPFFYSDIIEYYYMTQERIMTSDSFSTDAIEAKNNPDRLNLFIQENNKFIKQCAYKSIGRFITESDEEYSVAMRAFYEAVESYDENAGSFSSFAQMVIKRRLYDFLKTEYRRQPEISVEPYVLEGEIDEDNESALSFEVKEKAAAYQNSDNQKIQGKVTVRDEIEALHEMLDPYGFGFMDLADSSPHADKTRKACAKAVGVLLKNSELYEKMEKQKTLPMKELEKESKVSRKILDRYRRYIIAAVLILNGEYPLLAEYMRYIKDTLREL